MTVLAGFGYLLIAFSPSIAIFWRVIAHDPLRIILFVLGAFFWLLSLLFSALIWYAVYPLRDTLIFAVCISIALQEAARLLYFVLLKKAQKGLSRMAASGMHISGVHTLHHARHVLAVVSGLGMGVMAAVFLVVNVIADFWGQGTVGLPATVPEVSHRFAVKLYDSDQTFPVTYSLSACLITLCHLFWTILFWDGCHKKASSRLWWTAIAVAVISHYAFSLLSFLNRGGHHVVVLCLQALLLIANAIYSFFVMGGSWQSFRRMCVVAGGSLFSCRKPATPAREQRSRRTSPRTDSTQEDSATRRELAT